MPETKQPTATDYQKALLAAYPTMNRNYAKQVAYRTKRQLDWQREHDERIRNMPADKLFEAGLRILGIYSDITPREAIEGIAA